jgi:hypothetical protein
MPIVLLLLVVLIALALYMDRGMGDRTKGEDSNPPTDKLTR